jgi:hypothetical protein
LVVGEFDRLPVDVGALRQAVEVGEAGLAGEGGDLRLEVAGVRQLRVEPAGGFEAGLAGAVETGQRQGLDDTALVDPLLPEGARS